LLRVAIISRRRRPVAAADGGQRHAVVVLRGFDRHEPIRNILAHPGRVARERVAIAAAGRTDADEFLAGADLHMRHLRRQHIDTAILADQP
jgi:hypothetical protein